MSEKGLYSKYVVLKWDAPREDPSSNSAMIYCPGDVLDGCFVLRPEKDPVALRALIAYAAATPDRALRDDLLAWAERIRKENVK